MGDLAGHGASVTRKVAVNSRYVFLYSTLNGNLSRFTRINNAAQTCFHLFSNSGVTSCGGTAFTNTMYSMIGDPTATDDNIVRFCGGESQLLLVRINAADTSSPVFRETAVESCEQLSNL